MISRILIQNIGTMISWFNDINHDIIVTVLSWLEPRILSVSWYPCEIILDIIEFGILARFAALFWFCYPAILGSLCPVQFHLSWPCSGFSCQCLGTAHQKTAATSGCENSPSPTAAPRPASPRSDPPSQPVPIRAGPSSAARPPPSPPSQPSPPFLFPGDTTVGSRNVLNFSLSGPTKSKCQKIFRRRDRPSPGLASAAPPWTYRWRNYHSKTLKRTVLRVLIRTVRRSWGQWTPFVLLSACCCRPFRVKG